MSDPTRTRLLEPGFKYTRAAETNIARTFARIRREQKNEAAQAENVKPIRSAKRS